MGRRKQEICLRKRPDTPYFYYKTEFMRNYSSTGKTSKRAAYQYTLEQLGYEQTGQDPDIALKSFCKDFFNEHKKGTWANRQINKKRLSDSTLKWRKSHYDNHIKKGLGHLRINDLTPSRIDQWLDHLEYSPQSKKHYLTTLSTILNEAVREQYLASNPCRFVEVEKIQNTSNEPPTWDVILKLFPDDMNDFKKKSGERSSTTVLCAGLWSLPD